MDPLLALFERYNPAIWPLQPVAHLVAVAALALVALRPSRAADRLLTGLLAVLWAFIGIVFQGIFVRELDATLSVVYAAGFLAQAALFLWAGVQGRLAYRTSRSVAAAVGWLAIGYALVVYPAIGVALGHGYPAAPVFGAAPCPVTIFTFGALLLARPPVPARLLVLPLAWAIVATPAAVGRGVLEDVALLGFALVATALIVVRDRQTRRSAVRGPVGRPGMAES
jgi:hypothetical protein